MHKLMVSFAALLVSALALAASVHLKPPNRNPTFADGGLFLSTAGSIAGLGNGDVVVSLSATGNVIASCTNPAGQTQPPGQNPAPLTLTGVQIIPEDSIKNGNVSFNVQTTAAPSTIAGAPGCPNPQWTERIEDVAFTSATLTVEQPTGVVVLTVTCTLVPSLNGAVPTSSVACVIS
jgi:hypothetical protein